VTIDDVIELLEELGEEAEGDGLLMTATCIREAIDCLEAMKNE